MKNRLRLALPPLNELGPASPVRFAVLDRRHRLLRSGELPLNQLADNLPARSADVILHSGDAVVTAVDIPPLSASRLEAAVQARVEPMLLDDILSVCLGYGARRPDGRVPVAWSNRRELLQAWRQLEDAGLEVRSLHAFELAVAAQETDSVMPLAAFPDAWWQSELPTWSLARNEYRPSRPARRWRGALGWASLAALVWVVGLQLHASQLHSEAEALQKRMGQRVRAAFPSIPVVLDPLRQARNELAALQAAQGTRNNDDFLPLSIEAARLLGFASGRVTALRYDGSKLSLTLAQGYQPPGDELALQRAANAAGLKLEKDANNAHVWHVQRTDLNSKKGSS